MILSPFPDPPPLFLLSPYLPHLFLTPFSPVQSSNSAGAVSLSQPASACTCVPPGSLGPRIKAQCLLKYLSVIVPKTFQVSLALFWFSKAWARICLLLYLWFLSQMYNSSLLCFLDLLSYSLLLEYIALNFSSFVQLPFGFTSLAFEYYSVCSVSW